MYDSATPRRLVKWAIELGATWVFVALVAFKTLDDDTHDAVALIGASVVGVIVASLLVIAAAIYFFDRRTD